MDEVVMTIIGLGFLGLAVNFVWHWKKVKKVSVNPITDDADYFGESVFVKGALPKVKSPEHMFTDPTAADMFKTPNLDGHDL